VGVDLGHDTQTWSVAEDLAELRCMRAERDRLERCGHDVTPRALSISQAAVISPMWLNA
jgi:hypothetical protein